MASPPAAVMSRTVSSPSGTWTSATTTLAPSRAKICAVARPMPELPPVTNATFPVTRPAIRFLLYYVHHSSLLFTLKRKLDALSQTAAARSLVRGQDTRQCVALGRIHG